jgi:hypothetical protein
MTWRERLCSLLCATAATGCPIGGGFCGNANPDPCICGRDDTPAKQAECTDKKACEQSGGVWSDPYLEYATPGGVDASPPKCEMRDAGVPDAFVPHDAP